MDKLVTQKKYVTVNKSTVTLPCHATKMLQCNKQFAQTNLANYTIHEQQCHNQQTT